MLGNPWTELGQAARQRPRLLALLVAGGIVALLLVLGGPGARLVPALAAEDAAPGGWVVARAEGDARIRPSGLPWQSWEPLAAGDAVPPASAVETGADGQLRLERGGDVLELAPRTRIDVPVADPDRGGAFTRILQELGNLFVEVESTPGKRFEVETPYLTAVVKGTAFEVSVAGETAAVAVREGLVDVHSPDGAERESVAAGMVARVHAAAGPDIRVEPAPAAPERPAPAAAPGLPAPAAGPVIKGEGEPQGGPQSGPDAAQTDGKGSNSGKGKDGGKSKDGDGSSGPGGAGDAGSSGSNSGSSSGGGNAGSNGSSNGGGHSGGDSGSNGKGNAGSNDDGASNGNGGSGGASGGPGDDGPNGNDRGNGGPKKDRPNR